MTPEEKATKDSIAEEVEVKIETGDKETETTEKSAEEPKDEVICEDMASQLEAYKKEAAESHDRFLRTSAELENFRKRTAREMEEFRKYANESLIRELLPIVDNLERAMESAVGRDDVHNVVVQGVEMTLREILKVFEKFSVTPIESLGKPFDPTYHQAVMQEEVNTGPENMNLKELQKGYLIHDRLLRPAMVVVSKATEKK